MNIEVKDESGLGRAAEEFLSLLGDRRHVALHGAMGAGKTTFVRALCEALGITDDVNSPTFSIINEYAGADGRVSVYHFDFYRIDDAAQALDLGLDEYFDSGALCLMEWPGNVDPFLPEDTLDVEITVNPDGSRSIKI